MIKLRLYPSQRVHNYKTRSKAVSEVRSNGLKPYQYTLTDTKDNTTFKNGLWLTKSEMNLLRDGTPFEYIRLKRRRARR